MKILETGYSLSSEEEFYLKDSLVDIDEWVIQAIVGKINQCKKRFNGQWRTVLFNDPNVKTVPTTESEFINTVTLRGDYKTRAERELENP